MLHICFKVRNFDLKSLCCSKLTTQSFLWIRRQARLLLDWLLLSRINLFYINLIFLKLLFFWACWILFRKWWQLFKVACSDLKHNCKSNGLYYCEIHFSFFSSSCFPHPSSIFLVIVLLLLLFLINLKLRFQTFFQRSDNIPELFKIQLMHGFVQLTE